MEIASLVVFIPASTGMGWREAGFECPTVVFVTCRCFAMYIYSSCLVQLFYNCALFLVLAFPKEKSLQILSVPCGVRCPCGQGRVTAKLSFVSAFEAFKIHLSFQIPACRLGNAFPRGGQSS